MLFLYILLALVAIIAILGFIAPKDFAVERTIDLSVSQQTAYDALRSLKQQDEWSVWAKKDPNMEKDFRGTDGEVGSVSYWNGNKDVGEGEQEIMGLQPPHRIDTQLRFLKPFKSTNDAYFKIDAKGEGSHVAWGFSGSSPFPMNIFMMFMNIDKSVGGDFEQGLANFKAYIEE